MSGDVVKAKLKVLRTAVSNDGKKANGYQDVNNANCVEVEILLTKLRRHQTELADLDKQILEAGDLKAAELEQEVVKQAGYSTFLADAIDRLDVMLRRVPSVQPPVTQNSDTERKTKVKTPKLELTSYDGDPLRWEEFWDDFTCSVDSRTDLSTIDKLKLLKQSLKADALSLADGYYLTQRNYQEVNDALKDRFGDPQVAIFAHLEAFLDIEPANHDVESLVNIRDRCEVHIRSLQALGLSEDTYGLVFAPILLSKLPRFVKMEMHRRNGSKRWTLSALREHLKEEISVRTKSDRSFMGNSSDNLPSNKGTGPSFRSPRKQPRTGSILCVQDGKPKKKPPSSEFKPKARPDPKCIFCGGNHPNWECSKYPTVQTRLPLVKGRCFACFSDQHMKKDCRSRKKCFYCNEPGHNSSLCPKKFSGNSSSDSNSSDHSGIVNGLNPQAPGFFPQDAVHAVQSGRSTRRGGTAVLESASVQVRGPKGTTRARVVFDLGSTMSFVRSHLSKKVGAKPSGESRTTLSRFGDTVGEDKKYPLVQLYLQIADGSDLVLWLHQVDTVSAPVRLVPIPMENFSPIFQAADFPDMVQSDCNVDIDILLGLDHYYDIVGPEIWRSGSLVVKQTVIGKMVSGFFHHQASGADFLLALRRFAALHQSPEIIVSDNARQFKAADQLLQKTFKQLRSTSDISDYLTDKGIVWRFIVERAPWMGGFYERLVGTVKEALKKSVGKWTLTSQELQTILYEIAFVVNGRPLVYVDDDPSSPVLSPLDLLFRSTRCFPDNSGEDVFKEELTKADALLMHWRAGQNLLRQFWDIWQSHYLPSLRESSKIPQNRGASNIPVQEGAVVLIKENVPRGQWKVMPKVVEVVPGHPLSMNHTYAQGLTLHNIGITCIRQGYYYVKLLQHGQGKAAEDLITDPCLKWNPDRILSFSAKHIPNENVNFLCKSGEVMRAVLVDQLHNPGNPFRCALEEQMNLAADPRDLEFRIYNSNNEMVFTSGFKYGDWKTEVPGFNIYAHLLHELVLMILGDIPMENSLVEEFVSNPDLLKPVVPRSLLLVSDSQMRYIDKIQCGDVIPVSGGRYGEMIDVLQSPKFPLSEYQWIVVYCGINCNVKRSYALSQQDAEWQQLWKLLIDEASTRDKPSVLFCTSFDHPTANADNPGHVASIKAQLVGTRVISVDWKDLGDPFLKPNGTMNYELFDVRGKNPKAWPKEIHISRRATRMVWKTAFCHYLQGLKFIHYTEGKAPLSVPKPVFSAPLRALPVPKPLPDDQPGSSRQAPADPPFVPPFGHQRPAPDGPMFDDHPGPSHSVASRVVVPPPNQQDRRVLFQEQVRRSPPRQSRLEPRAPTGRRAEDRHGASPPRHSRLEHRTPANRRAEDRRDYRNGDRKRQHDDKRR